MSRRHNIFFQKLLFPLESSLRERIPFKLFCQTEEFISWQITDILENQIGEPITQVLYINDTRNRGLREGGIGSLPEDTVHEGWEA